MIKSNILTTILSLALLLGACGKSETDDAASLTQSSDANTSSVCEPADNLQGICNSLDIGPYDLESKTHYVYNYFNNYIQVQTIVRLYKKNDTSPEGGAFLVSRYFAVDNVVLMGIRVYFIDKDQTLNATKAHDADGNMHELTRMDTPPSKGMEEVYAIDIDSKYLSEHVNTGIDICLTGPDRELNVTLPADTVCRHLYVLERTIDTSRMSKISKLPAKNFRTYTPPDNYKDRFGLPSEPFDKYIGLSQKLNITPSENSELVNITTNKRTGAAGVTVSDIPITGAVNKDVAMGAMLRGTPSALPGQIACSLHIYGIRDDVLNFNGCYDSSSDELLVENWRNGFYNPVTENIRIPFSRDYLVEHSKSGIVLSLRGDGDSLGVTISPEIINDFLCTIDQVLSDPDKYKAKEEGDKVAEE